MDRSAIVASVASILLLVGCGHAVRDSVKTSGEAAERATSESDRTRSAMFMAEDARNAARDAAAAAADPPTLGDRDDFIEDQAEDAKDRAEDAKDRAEDARKFAEDLRDRLKDAEEAANRASEWMFDRGFYTTEVYWDCGRYRGSKPLEDQPEACANANEARALAELVRWRVNRAQTVAKHAQVLANETRALALLAESERRDGPRRERARRETEQLQSQAAEQMAEVNTAYAEQNREWQQLQERSGGWLEGAERTYAAIKQEEDSGGGWMSALVGGAIGAAVGATRASQLGLTGSEAADMVTLTGISGAESGPGAATRLGLDVITEGALVGRAFDTFGARRLPAGSARINAAGTGAFSLASESLDLGTTAMLSNMDARTATQQAFEWESRLSEAQARETTVVQALDAAQERESTALRAVESARAALDEAAQQEAAVLEALEAVDHVFVMKAAESPVYSMPNADASGATRRAPERASQLPDAQERETAAQALGAAQERESTALRAVESARAALDEAAQQEAAALEALEAVDSAFAMNTSWLPAYPATRATGGNQDSSSPDAFATPESELVFERHQPESRHEETELTGFTPEPNTAGIARLIQPVDSAFVGEITQSLTDSPTEGSDSDSDSTGESPFATLEAIVEGEDPAVAATPAVADLRDEETELTGFTPEPNTAGIARLIQPVDSAFVGEITQSLTDSPTEGSDSDSDSTGESPFATLEAIVEGEGRTALKEASGTESDDFFNPATAGQSVASESAVAAVAGTDPAVAATPEFADLREWVQAVGAELVAAEAAAADTVEASVSGTASWFSRMVLCVNAGDRLTSAYKRVEELSVGNERPAFITVAAGAEVYEEAGDRLEAAQERVRLACESVERPW